MGNWLHDVPMVCVGKTQSIRSRVQGSMNMLAGRLAANGRGRKRRQGTDNVHVVVEEVEVDGQEAMWMQAGDEGLLVWEAQGVNYQLASLGDLELALRVAESVK